MVLDLWWYSQPPLGSHWSLFCMAWSYNSKKIRSHLCCIPCSLMMSTYKDDSTPIHNSKQIQEWKKLHAFHGLHNHQIWSTVCEIDFSPPSSLKELEVALPSFPIPIYIIQNSWELSKKNWNCYEGKEWSFSMLGNWYWYILYMWSGYMWNGLQQQKTISGPLLSAKAKKMSFHWSCDH